MRWHDLDRAPAIFEIGGFALLDFGLLRRPKGVAVRKIAIFLEQVGDDLTRIVGHVEQRRLDRNRAAAEQPCLQLRTARGIRIVALEQRQPRSLLRLVRSEEHTSALQSLMRISYAVFCLKKKNKNSLKH